MLFRLVSAQGKDCLSDAALPCVFALCCPCYLASLLRTVGQINGLLGLAARSEKKSSAVADSEIGLGGTSQWKLCGLDADTTLAVLFEITGNGSTVQEQGQVSHCPCVIDQMMMELVYNMDLCLNALAHE